MSSAFRSLNALAAPGDDRKVEMFSDAEAELLRRYKRFLQAHDLREKLWCVTCGNEGRQDGLRASVLDGRIDFECRCTVRRHRGQTF